jgi:acetyl-CoA carboxylase biotin carboxyl carrier protein
VEPQQIKAFIDAMAASDLSEMEFSQEGWTLRLVRRAASAALIPSATAPESASGSIGASRKAAATTVPNLMAAPLFGVVHLQQSPGDPPFVSPGQAIEAGQTLCVIEAMKVFNEVRAEHDAIVAAVLVESGQEVEAGQPLFRFE